MIKNIQQNIPQVQVITVDEISKQYAINLINSLRILNIKTRYDYKVNIKKSLKQANQEKIKLAVIIGESEVKNNTYTIKNLFDNTQNIVSYENLLSLLT